MPQLHNSKVLVFVLHGGAVPGPFAGQSVDTLQWPTCMERVHWGSLLTGAGPSLDPVHPNTKFIQHYAQPCIRKRYKALSDVQKLLQDIV